MRKLCTSLVLALLLGATLSSSAQALQFVQPAGSPFGYASEEANDIAVGDLNGDGRDDVVTANWGPLFDDEPSYTVLLGQVNGSLSPVSGSPVPLPSEPLNLALGDFDNDSALDLAMTIGARVDVYLGNDDGTFAATPSATLITGEGPVGLAAGRLDGDEDDDIAVGNFESDDLSVFYSDGDGSFTEANESPYPVDAEEPISVAIGDLDGDGLGDVATANRGTLVSSENAISVLLADGAGDYESAPGSPLTGEYESEDIAIGNVDANATLDLVTVSSPNSGVVVKLGAGDGTFAEPPGGRASYPSHTTGSVTLADFNSDGRDDVALPIGSSVGEVADDTVWVFESAADGSLAAPEGNPFPVAPASFPGTIQSGDFNDDGVPDLVTANFSDDLTVLLRNDEPQPELVVEPEWLDFGEVELNATSAAQQVRVANEGVGPLSIPSITVLGPDAGDFAADAADCGDGELEPGEECTVEVTFAPTEQGNRAAYLEVTQSFGQAAEVELSGIGFDTPEASISPTSFAFGGLPVGEGPSGAMTFEVENISQAWFEIESVAIAGDDASEFELEYDGCSGEFLFSEGEFCEVEVIFNPQTLGAKSATVTVESSDLDAPLTASITGTGEPNPEIDVLPPSWDAGGTSAGTGGGPTQVFSVESSGATPLEVGTPALSGPAAADFEVVRDECSGESLAPLAECEIEVEFAPAAVGAKEATLEVPSNAAGTPTAIALSGTGTANPGATLTPSSHNFGTVPHKVRSAPQAFTLASTGTTPLTVGTATLDNEFAGFEFVANNCNGAVLDPGESCVVEVALKPVLFAGINGQLKISSDAPGSPATASLSGVGTSNPQISFTPSNHDFGARMVDGGPSATQTFTIESTGTTELVTDDTPFLTGDNAADFEILSEDCDGFLEPGESCSIQVAFDPTSIGHKSAQLRTFSNAGTTSVMLSGTGIVRELGVTPSGAGFGSVPVGTISDTTPVTLASTGGAPVTIESVEWSGDSSQFQIVGDDCEGAVIESGNSCVIDVAFAPSGIGAKAATLSIAANAPGSPWTVAFSGAGAASPGLSLTPVSHDFGGVTVDLESTDQLFTVESTGTTPVTISSVDIGGPDAGEFDISDQDCAGSALAPDDTCQVEARFLPQSIGPQEAELSIVSDAPGSPATAALAGTGLADPRGGVEPDSLDFGSRTVGDGPGEPQAVEIESSGATPLEIDGLAITGPGSDQFQLAANDCTVPLDEDEVCEVAVAFSPNAAGTHEAKLEILTNRPAGSLTVALTGTGLAKPTPPGPPAPPGPPTPPTPAPPTPPALPGCTTTPQVQPPTVFEPEVKDAPGVPGLRARFAIDAPALLEVSGKVRFRAGGKNHLASLGKLTLRAAGRVVNYKAPLPAQLRERLPLGTPVTLLLRYRTGGTDAGCALGEAKTRKLATQIVRIKVAR